MHTQKLKKYEKQAYKIGDYVSITIANYRRIKSKIALRPRFSFACILHIAEPIILFIIELIMLKSMA